MNLSLVEHLLDPRIIALSAGIIAVIHFIGLIPVGKITLGKHKRWRRFLPLLPLLLGIGGAFLVENFGANAQQINNPIITGCWAGFVASHGRKIFKHLVINKLKE